MIRDSRRILRRNCLRILFLGLLGATMQGLHATLPLPTPPFNEGWSGFSPILGRVAAIDRCSAQGGAHVVVPPGTWWLNGPIRLKSNVNLHLEAGATLRFNPDPDFYLPPVPTRWEGTGLFNHFPFWCVHMVSTRNVILRDLRVESPLINNDGIDVESSTDVLSSMFAAS